MAFMAGELRAAENSGPEGPTRRYTRLGACIITMPPPAEPARLLRNDRLPAPKPLEPVSNSRLEPIDVDVEPARELTREPARKLISGPSLGNWKPVPLSSEPAADADLSPAESHEQSGADSDASAPIVPDEVEPAAAPLRAATRADSKTGPAKPVGSPSDSAQLLSGPQQARATDSFPHGEWWLVSIGVQAVGAVVGVLNWLLLTTLLILLVHPRFVGRVMAAMPPVVIHGISPAAQTAAADMSPSALDHQALSPVGKAPLETKIIELHTLLDEAAGTWAAEREAALLEQQQAETAILSSIYDENLEVLGNLSLQAKAA